MDVDRTFAAALEDRITAIAGSGAFVQLYNPDMGNFRADPWPAVELAIAILLDKPIVLAVPRGREAPAKLLAIADHVVRGDVEEIGQGIVAYMRELREAGNG